jgi:dTDP-4-dehydrorhamnose reductase
LFPGWCLNRDLRQSGNIVNRMIQKLIVFGHTGMLGRYIVSYFSNKIQVFTPNFRIVDNGVCVADIERALAESGIDSRTCVINCVGSIPQRNKDAKTFYVINGVFPHVLSALCLKYSAEMIQPTTDCVFNGQKGAYIETDTHDESNPYGLSKSIGEPPDCTVIRTSIIGEEVCNKKSFLEFVRTSTGQIHCWVNHMWNGVTCLEYCKVIDSMLANHIFWKGVRHIYSPRAVSKYELACMIRDSYGLDTDVVQSYTESPCDKTLCSIHSPLVVISDLAQQIRELHGFNLHAAYQY